jgi:hypothetical protein
MKPFKAEYRLIIAVILFSLTITFPVVSQEANTWQNQSEGFFLTPVLEILFSQNLRWRPDWPSYIPPDGFVIHEGNEKYQLIELSNEDYNFSVIYDRTGRLLEFPYFYSDSYAVIKASYTENGALSEMNVAIKNYSFSDENSLSEIKIINVNFPFNFLPYSAMSPGGAFPPIKISFEESVYHVFIFESPLFLTETWYDEEGNILFFSNALVDVDENRWRIRAMEIQDTNDIYFIDYYFDSYGNTTEIKLSGNVFNSLYNGNMPNYWRYNDQKYELSWDTQNILRIIKASEFIDGIYCEYRYDYDFDINGNWINRQEIAYIMTSNLLVTDPSYSRGIWTRRIVFFE